MPTSSSRRSVTAPNKSTLRTWWGWFRKAGWNAQVLAEEHTEVTISAWQKRLKACELRLKEKRGEIQKETAMTPKEAIQLIKIWEAHKCNASSLARTLRSPRPTVASRIDRAKLLTSWEPKSTVFDPDDGLDAGLLDVQYDKIKAALATGDCTFVVTSAQNSTDVYKPFWRSLKSYCKFNNAILIVIPYRYHNPTSVWGQKAKDDDWWADEILEHALNRRISLNKNVMIMGDIKTQPTAVNPLSGFETISHASSAIIGHPKLELNTIATPQNRLPKILTTTGSCTKQNYTPTKAGKKGEHHHTFGAAVVEIRGNKFHLRQINATRDGSFMELMNNYDGDEVTPIERIEGLVMGDTHVEVVDPDVVKATFGKGGIVAALKPKTLVWHDLHDFYSRNHHHLGKVIINFVKHHTGKDNVQRALDETFDFVNKHTPVDTTNVFVYSNHPDALQRWVQSTDPRTDPENALVWAKFFTYMCENAKMERQGVRVPDPFAWYGRQKLEDDDRNLFLHPQQSYLIKNIETGYHGDAGPGGSRGSRASFSKIGTKVIIGHGHSPGIKDGVYQVGTSSLLDLEYVKGPTAWLHTHCIIYPNGKRSLINIIEGEWRG